jgi:hypothetical protein
MVEGIAMPLIFRQGPYRVFFYSNEGDPREPMHVHVKSGDGEAKIWMAPFVSVADCSGFNSRQLKDICDMIVARRRMIEIAWHDHFRD